MERSDEEAPLPEQDRLTVELAQHLHAVAGALKARRTDEDASQRSVLSGQLEVGLEAEHLPPIRVPGHLEVDEAEVVTVEHDQPGAGAEDRLLEAADRI